MQILDGNENKQNNKNNGKISGKKAALITLVSALVLGGAVGGLYAGITQFVFYAFVNPGIAAIPAFISQDGTFTNFINGIITMVISFAVAFLYVMFTPYNELPADQIKEITSED